MKYRALISLLVASQMLAGCDFFTVQSRRPDQGPPEPVHVVRFVYVPATNQQCPCRQVDPTVARVHVKNLSPVSAAAATYRVRTFDLQTNTPINVSPPLQTGRIEPDQLKDINSCTVTPDSSFRGTVTAENAAAVCRIKSEYEILESVLLDRVSYKENYVPIAEADVMGPAYCKAQCEANNENCYNLGPGEAKLSAALIGLLDSATQTNATKISAKDLYGAYGAQVPTGVCARGDTIISNTTVVNEGVEACYINGASVAALYSSLSTGEKIAMLTRPVDTSITISKRLELTKSPSSQFANGLGTFGLFQNSEQSIDIYFKRSPLSTTTPEEIAEMNSYFAGYVRDITYFIRPQNGRRAISISTPRGCIAVDAPNVQ